MTNSLKEVHDQMWYELEMTGVDGDSFCCIDTDVIHGWITSVKAANLTHTEEVVNHNRLKEDTWIYEQRLINENCELRNVLSTILKMQTRGSITLGDKITNQALVALGG